MSDLLTTTVIVTWNFGEILCDDCGAAADPNVGGGLASFNDPRRSNEILCDACLELYSEDIYAIVFRWKGKDN